MLNSWSAIPGMAKRNSKKEWSRNNEEFGYFPIGNELDDITVKVKYDLNIDFYHLMTHFPVSQKGNLSSAKSPFC